MMKDDIVEWKGNNLREVIDLIGLHPSVSMLTWDEYEDLVKREGLKIITPTRTFKAEIGDYISLGGEGQIWAIDSTFYKSGYSHPN